MDSLYKVHYINVVEEVEAELTGVVAEYVEAVVVVVVVEVGMVEEEAY
jgi:hypothetical protein